MMSNCRDLWTDAGETVHTTLGIVRVPDASPLHPSPVGILSAVQHLGRHRDHTGRGTAATDRGRREDPARLTPRRHTVARECQIARCHAASPCGEVTPVLPATAAPGSRFTATCHRADTAGTLDL